MNRTISPACVAIATLLILIAEVPGAPDATAQNATPQNATAQNTTAQNATVNADVIPWKKFRWEVGPPLLAADASKLPPTGEHPWIAVKDPSVIKHQDRWHLFCTLRTTGKGDGRIRIGHLTFDDWSNAKEATWSVLNLTMDYHGAPQIFYFRPHAKWYLIYQATDPKRGLKFGPCFSTNTDIDDPEGWTLPQPLYEVKPGKKAGLDFWVICDEEFAYLFFTTLDGRMWRCRTKLDSFPDRDWTDPVVALRGDIFEASHTYKIAGRSQYLTFIEAQADRRRYFKAYVADRLDSTWTPIAASRESPMVAPTNVINQESSWATSYSHGEFIRIGTDERLEIDPDDLQLLFQGASDKEYKSGDYGLIPWRLGLLRAR